MGIRERLARLEQRSAGGGMIVVLIEGGLPAPDGATHAEAWRSDGWREHFRRTDGETEAAFKDRVTAEAKARACNYVTIGGLPPMDLVA